MNIFAPLIRRPIGTLLMALGLAMAGLWAYLLLGVAALPTIEFPGMSVYAEVPGANAQTMASSVAAPLERHLGRIPGIKEMDSSSNDGSTSIVILFEPGRSTDKLARDVEAAINASAADLPSTMTIPPRYFKFNTSGIPVLLMSITSHTLPPDRLFDLTDTLIKPAMSQIPGVAQVRVMGGRPKAVRVELDNNALAARNLTGNDVRNALRAANVTSPQGLLTDGKTNMTVTATDQLSEPKDFADVLISVKNGVPVRLSDVARVYSGQQDEYQAAWFNGQRSVSVRISKRPEANAVATADAVRAMLPQIRAWLPADLEITPIFDLTQTTKSALREVQIALMLSVLMVAVVMLVFLRRVRPTLIAMFSVPLSLAGAFIVMWSLGYTLNTLSLVALVLCIGFVVDDAIVVIENIVRHMEHGEAPLPAALVGVREIGFTVISITLSLVAVFVPLLFGNSQFTLLMREFSVTLTAAVVISAVVSLTVTPALCGRYFRTELPGQRQPGRIEAAVERFDRKVHHIYERALDWALHHRRLMRWQPPILLVVTILLAVAVVKSAGFNFMPQEDIGMIQGDIRADANISPLLMAERAKKAAAIMRDDPAVLDVTTFLGSDRAGGAVGNQATMFVDLKPKGDGPGQRPEHIDKVIERLGKAYEKLPELRVSLRSIGFFNGGGGGGSNGSESFQLVSTNSIDLQPWVYKVTRMMRDTKVFRDVTSDYDTVDKQQMLKVDRKAAGRLHVSMGMVDTALYNAFGQNQVSIIYSDINQYWVVLTSAAERSLSPEALLNTYVRNNQGGMVPLSAIAHIEPAVTPSFVNHYNQLESAQIYYNLPPNYPRDKAMGLIESVMNHAGLPAGVKLAYTGENEQLQDTQDNTSILLLGSILAMYIVLGMLYESLGQPLTILSTLPAAGAGAFLAMLVTHTPLSLIGVIAILMLIGIVKKNAILMVDFALVAEREYGMSSLDAIRQAALVRFRPITMTTLVAIGAALPLAIGFGIGSEMRQPLGVAIVGGLLVSQLLTLLSTPAIYLWNYDRLARHAMGLMPLRLKWTSGVSVALGSAMGVAALVYLLAPALQDKLSINPLASLPLMAYGAALAWAGLKAWRKVRRARFVVLGLLAVVLAPAMLVAASAYLNDQGGLMGVLLPAALLAYVTWAVFSRRTRHYFAERLRQVHPLPAPLGA
ncbi:MULTISPECIES: efflux RND transporter permease subunit [Dyella]|uniref:Efflux RND transporter permease subunit n=2 Tax=Dyella TaxID=231454 RepID=A0A4R0YJA9_9GAMM|nr:MULTISPECIES: efflux RND transporter permease subunit [Dyella]TBR35944.1 efflux RND transporter permease subunit [Dyella terrae]TCI08509.1 efflux RND transporter permease subunit [Dyella soli]